ncbi:hypothetical protein [Rubinisphaera sp. JC750]|uniref:DoxX family protein n=1 Tax=Rubinisphaera sp. JC750 TaxID=2898658 RepID=UPI001F335F73|nr:hypothetical protein [Rubinisphaera sp. JC750]
MTTTLLLLALLTGPWLLTQLWNSLPVRSRASGNWAGLFGLTLLFAFTGVGHFILTRPMADMLPKAVPFRVELVYATGVLEILLALAVLLPNYRRLVGWLLLAMLAAFLPVNIYAAVNHIGPGGHQWGPIYLLIRIPLQGFLAFWVWRFAVKSGKPADNCDIAPPA